MNKKGDDLTVYVEAGLRFFVYIPPKTGFLAVRPIVVYVTYITSEGIDTYGGSCGKGL